MFVVSDCSARSVRSAGRINQLIKQLNTKVNQIYLILNKATPEDAESLAAEIEKTGLTLAGVIPGDPRITEYDIKGKPLFELPEDSPAVNALYEILDRLKI
jgi:CO dehydrogenase maturation factor